MGSRSGGAVLLLLVGLAPPPAAAAGLRVEPPPGWQSESPPAHPNLLAAFRHRTGARVAIAFEYLRDGATLESFVDGNVKALARMGFRAEAPRPRAFSGQPGIELRARSRDGKQAQVQVYGVRANKGFVVTLSVDAKLLERALAPFGELLDAVRLP